MVALDGDTGAPGAGARGGTGTDTEGERYANTRAGTGHHLSTPRLVAICVVVIVAVTTGSIGYVVACAAVFAVGLRSTWVFVLAMCLGCGGVVRGDQSRAALEPNVLGAFSGWVRVVDDPQSYPGATRTIVQVGDERFEIWTRGRARQLRAQEWRGGEWVAMQGVRTRLTDERAGRVAWQHVVGEFEVEWASDVRSVGGLSIASNRVRAMIERAGATLPHDDGALFRGLVVGDDRDQPRAMIQRFRASGLSHLTAVSGQNVSFLLAAAGPVLRRLRPAARWTVTVGLIIWFVMLTRFEPSIVRAGVMAGLSATAFVLGRERSSIRILTVAVLGLVLVDPLLVLSVGFWLSVGATAGVSGVGPWIATRLARLRGMRLFALPLGVTLGAQLGVAIPSVLVFGRLPLVSIPANLLAVPVAGAVMLYGLPAALLAGSVPQVATVVMFPARLGTRWVDTVAMIGARLEPGPHAQIVGWVLVLIVLVVLLRISRNTADTHGDLPSDR